ncbi:MAG: hypothetical protein AAGU11_08930 [Syntrophobacteraceae bacterium]
MDLVNKEQIKELMQMRHNHCISVFLPTHRAGREIEQDPIRLDNLLRSAEKELIAKGMRSTSAREMLAPAYSLTKDGFFARRMADGLSIFASPDFFKYYRAPIHFEEQLSIGNRFLIKPLIPMLSSGNRFYILAISRKSVRLLQCTEFGATEIQLEGVPKSMDEALGYDDDEARLMFRSISQASNIKDSPMFHGHGGGAEVGKEYLRNYFQKLRDSLHPYLREEKAPLVFSGVEYLFPIFKDVNLYQNTLSESIDGNPDGMDPHELHQQALGVVRPYLESAQQEAIQRITDTSCNGQCSFQLEKIVQGAFNGRVDTLLVNLGAKRWGKYDEVSGSVELRDTPAPGDEDLIDRAAVETYLNGGTVFPVLSEKMPGTGDISALFRY